jgi:hypothetical protein
LQIGLYGLFGCTTADLLKSKTGLDLPWWTVALLGVAIVAVAVFGFRRIDVNARVLGVLLAVDFLTVLVFRLRPARGRHVRRVARPARLPCRKRRRDRRRLLLRHGRLHGLRGRRPLQRGMPRPAPDCATYIAVAAIGVVYAFTAWAMTVGTGTSRIIGRAQKDGPGLVFALADAHVGKLFADLAQLFLVTSLFAALLSFHNAVTRYFFFLGREGVLPARPSRTLAVHGSPHIGSLT